MSVEKRARESTYTVQLQIFEGPLDLLLHLLRQQEIDIYDIPIAQITDQYLEYLEMMKDLNVTIAGEFLVMAATLIHMKSQMLLPQDPDPQIQEEIEEFRRDLTDRLLEHERFKRAAQLLYEQETLELAIWTRGETEFEEEEKEAVAANVFDLVSAFHTIVERYKEQIVFAIETDPVTVEEKMQEIRRLLRVQGEFLFSFFFRHKVSRMHLVVTFFALLELARLREIHLRQKDAFEDILIQAC